VVVFMTDLLQEIIDGLTDGEVKRIVVGAHWTGVEVEQEGRIRCGLASNPIKDFQVGPELTVRLSELTGRPGLEVCRFAISEKSLLTSVGLATINALMPLQPARWVERNARDVIAQKGEGKRVALVGHFPFVPEVREQVGRLDVLELRPREGDYHAREAPRIIPQAEVVAITSMAFVNGTINGLLELIAPDSYVIILGPSTPLSPLLFAHGIDMLCGSIVELVDPVLDAIHEGNSFRQIKKSGVRLVTIEK